LYAFLVACARFSITLPLDIALLCCSDHLCLPLLPVVMPGLRDGRAYIATIVLPGDSSHYGLFLLSDLS